MYRLVSHSKPIGPCQSARRKGEAWAKIEEEKKKKGTTTKAWRLDARGKIDIGIAS
jgi:hypothetical protein